MDFGVKNCLLKYAADVEYLWTDDWVGLGWGGVGWCGGGQPNGSYHIQLSWAAGGVAPLSEFTRNQSQRGINK